MIRNTFQPWGSLQSILNHKRDVDWAFIGSISPEDRCISTVKTLLSFGSIEQNLIFQIESDASRFKNESMSKIGQNRQRLSELAELSCSILEMSLFAKHQQIFEALVHFFGSVRTRNLLIDITCLPKRIFFLAIKLALSQNNRFENIIVTYAEPECYGESPLAEDPEDWRALPGFASPFNEPELKNVIIGIGFEPLGLPRLYGNGNFSQSKTSLLFPFPSQPDRVRKNWDFIRNLSPDMRIPSTDIHRVDASNVPDIFDQIETITHRAEEYTILAPFGPKPVSLAMCLFAVKYSNIDRSPSVFYTQPTVYNPSYSCGIKTSAEGDVVNAYCIRLNANNLY